MHILLISLLSATMVSAQYKFEFATTSSEPVHGSGQCNFTHAPFTVSVEPWEAYIQTDSAEGIISDGGFIQLGPNTEVSRTMSSSIYFRL